VTALTLRSLAARKARTALTAAAVVLGVGLISGTLILTATINRTFDDVFKEATSGFDVAVQAKQVVKEEFDSEPPPISERYVARVRAVPGVKAAEGSVFTQGIVYDKQGERLSTHAPNFIASAGTKPFDPFDYVDGHAPRGPDEVALDRKTADDEGFKLGDTVEVSGDGPRRRLRLVGIAKFGNLESLAGANAAIVTLPEAQRLGGLRGELNEIDVTAKPGVSRVELRDRIARALPASITVRTAQQQADEQARSVKEDFSFINIALLVFAGIALFVGAFIIFNSFSMTVAQRMREFAMLRTLGASRRQILRSVVLEATIVGLAASVLGVLAGLGLAPALLALFRLFGLDLPAEGTVLPAGAIVFGLLIGTLVTMGSSLSPALRATRVPPILALREGAVLPPGRSHRFRTPVAIALSAIGLAVILYGLFADAGSGGAVAGLLGAGAVAIFIGVAMLSSKLVQPIASVVGWPLERLRGVTGRLARENALRNPGRTASTAAALMIGLALVTFVAIFAAGVKGSVADAIDEEIDAQLVVQNSDGFSGVPAATEGALARVPGVAVATPLQFSESKVTGVKGNAGVTGLDPRQGPRAFRVEWKQGSPATLSALGPRDTVVDDAWAKDNGIKVGGRMRVLTPTAKRLVLRVRGSYKDRLDFGGDYIIPSQTLRSQFGVKQDQFVLVRLYPNADEKAVRRDADRALAGFPQVELLTRQGFKDDQGAQLNQVLGLIYVLLALSVIVSLFGIVNTLALAIHERTRELGMLRAIGTSRAQVRRIVRYESVITALIGAVIGAVLGVCFALVISRPLESEGFSLSFPVGTILVLLVLSGVAGVLAAIGPARRASRLDVLEALAYE
jgi:putative ABC transport system permease protein